METRAHHLLIGAFTIAVFVAALGFVLWLSRSSVDSSYHDYDIIFTEAVSGLGTGGTVQYNGIKVGEVQHLSLDRQDPRKVVARVRLDASAPVREDTRAQLALQGVTGVSLIQLSGGAPDSPPLRAAPGQEVPVIPSEESALTKLLASGSDIALSANEVLLRVGHILSDRNIERIGSTLDNIELLSGALADQRGSLGAAVGNLAAATDDLRTALRGLDDMMQGTADLVRVDVREALAAARTSLEAVDKVAGSFERLVEDNRDAVSTFSNQGLRQVGPTMAELREALRSLRQLSDKLGASDSLLLGRNQPREYQP